jgi:hypothetical protein
MHFLLYLKYLENTNITIVAALPHTHLQGKEVWTKIIRNGKDMGYLFRNKHYDFNYQQNFIINPPVVLTKVCEKIANFELISNIKNL